MNTKKPIREQISYKQHEAYLRSIRDQLCQRHKMNKSDLMKHLIQKEHQLTLSTPSGDIRK